MSVYINDVLLNSRTVEEHPDHLILVHQQIQHAFLKLKPFECHFAQKEVEYLDCVITADELSPNPKLVTAVKELPAPKNVKEVREILRHGIVLPQVYSQVCKRH